MQHIDSFHVEGFWEQFSFGTKLHRDVSIFIGENGTGKTTLINLIAAALSADFLTLDRLPFEKLEIRLRTLGSNVRPRITVQKNRKESTGIDGIEYRIARTASGPEVRFLLDDIEEQRRLRQNMYIHVPMPSTIPKRANRDLTNTLKELISISWLSIHRNSLSDAQADVRLFERNYDSSVDAKLAELNTRISRYYSVLTSKRQESVREFQEFIFLSLLEERQESRVFDIIRSTDLESEKNNIVDAFQRLGVGTEKFKRRANHLFNALQRIRSSTDAAYSLSDFGKLIALQQIQQITQRWDEEKAKQDRIFGDFNSFMSIVNKLLVGKSLTISAASELVVESAARGRLEIFQLSSGEKQLLILLGEALLQKHAPYVYIADEPELSLHLRWQEQIIPNIRSLNEKAQMIVATHSPDIIGKYGKNVIRMEKLLRNGR